MPNLTVKSFFLIDCDLESRAIISKQLKLNYRELSSRVNSAKQSLLKLGVTENDHVGLPGFNNHDFIIAVIALWQIGAVPVPFNPKFRENELESLIKLSNCKFILINDTIKLKNNSARLISLEIKSESDSEVENTFDLPEFNKTAVIIFTSGTSTLLKAVELSFKSLFESAKIGNKILEHNRDDKWLASLPFFHISGFSIITRALLFRSPIIIPESFNEKDLKEAIENFKPSLCSLVPTQLKRMKELNIKNLDQLRHVLIGGGYSDSKLITEAIQSGWNITKVYGSTETCAFVTAITGDDLLYKTKSVGKAITPNIISIINEKHIAVSAGDSGEIIIESPSVMKGYYADTEETKNKFYENFYLSGDLGYLDDEGYLYVESRRTDLIVTGGENVNPFEVESELLNHPDISEVVVFPIDDEEWGQIVAAAIVVNSKDVELTQDDVQSFLSKEISGYKIPKRIFIKDKLPLNELGKVNRQMVSDLINSES